MSPSSKARGAVRLQGEERNRAINQAPKLILWSHRETVFYLCPGPEISGKQAFVLTGSGPCSSPWRPRVKEQVPVLINRDRGS